MSMRKMITVAAIAASAVVSSPSLAVAKETTLALAGYTGTTTLTNFQALVKLSEGRFGFSYDDYAAKDGADLWFADSLGNVIPHEIDTWNASGDSYVWVRVPEVSGTDTKIVMHWGEAKTAEQTATENVWKNYGDGKGGFAGVWHMEANQDDEPDAADNGLVAKRAGGNIGQMTAASGGMVGSCRVNQTVAFGNANGNGLDVSGYGNHITDVARFTLSGWFRATAERPSDIWTQMFSSEKWRARGGQKGQLNIVVSITVNGIEIADPAPSALPASEGFVDTWCYLVVVFDGTSCRLYANGKSLGSWTDKTAVSEFAEFFRIGNVWNNTNRGWYGKYDEVRLYDGAQSEDRVKADYATAKSPDTFVISADTPPYTATWTGAVDGNAANAANWTCYNVSGDKLPDGTMPTTATDATIAGDGIAITASTNAPLAFKSVNVGNCTLGANCDLRGFGAVTIPDGSMVDLNGHSLKMPPFSGNGVVTNSVAGDAAPFYAYVPEGASLRNGDTAIGGNLRFIKEGAGNFTAVKTNQGYTGGTLVNAGAIICATRGQNWPVGASGSTIEIGPDGVFDVDGYVAYHLYAFVLNGGTLKSSLAIRETGWTMWSNVRLTADSIIELGGNYGFAEGAYGRATLDLGGNRLTVKLNSSSVYFQLYNTQILNGSIENTSGGYIRVYNPNGDSGSNTFDFKAAIALHLERALVVRDYVALNKWTGSNDGNGNVNVHRVFRPTAAAEGCYHSGQMQNGSTIDLTDWPSDKGWPMYSRFTKGGKQLSFANGTVNVKLDSTRADVRALAKTKSDGAYAGYLLKWGTTTGTLATRNTSTTFVLDADSALKYKLKDDGTGLLLLPKGGFLLIVK